MLRRISKEAVQSASRSSKEFRGCQKGNIFNPGVLAGGTEYFWRIDAVGAGGKTVKGAVSGLLISGGKSYRSRNLK